MGLLFSGYVLRLIFTSCSSGDNSKFPKLFAIRVLSSTSIGQLAIVTFQRLTFSASEIIFF